MFSLYRDTQSLLFVKQYQPHFSLTDIFVLIIARMWIKKTYSFVQVISVILNEIHFIAGFYGALCLAYAIPLCLEREELGFFTSVSLSFRMAHRDIANNIILSLVSYCMLTIGTLLFFISYPMAYFMYGFAYLHIFGLQGVVIAVSQHQAA
eukprot:TRINITY_DN6330_c0_g1_i1.p1 TRINITY_DN6330_c0_g1~~TRINITY_DN6330_c0_g1_i1.p1  ORF type:complete len:151 (-),score=16.35 TRINITY_DN6330_c0_g1_i1:119-571(-)